MTRMARPIAASPAATVSTNIANTWPTRSCRKARERDEVDVHREQDQLDRHQDDDDVLAVEEDAEHAEHEQDRSDDDDSGRGRSQLDPLRRPAGCMLRVASCGRRRDLLRRRSAPRTSRRLRWVSTIAPIIATSRTSPAASNMYR